VRSCGVFYIFLSSLSDRVFVVSSTSQMHRTSHVTRYKPNVTSQTSHVKRYPSHATCHSTCVTRHTLGTVARRASRLQGSGASKPSSVACSFTRLPLYTLTPARISHVTHLHQMGPIHVPVRHSRRCNGKSINVRVLSATVAGALTATTETPHNQMRNKMSLHRYAVALQVALQYLTAGQVV